MNRQTFTRTILLFASLQVFYFSSLFGQKTAYEILIKAADSGTPLPGATIASLNSNFRVISDSSGSATIPEAIIHKGEKIEITMIGYKNFTLSSKDLVTKQTIELEKDLLVLEKVVVSENNVLSKVKDIQMGTVTISAVEARKLPSILGEVDIIKLLQLKPGVKNSRRRSRRVLCPWGEVQTRT